MPNHVTNIVSFEGEKSQVEELLEMIKSDRDSVIDFEKIIPMPSNIYKGNLGIEEEKKYEKNNWYDWSIENWGTKWNAYYTEYRSENCIKFCTAWSSPHNIIKKLSELFPKITITINWADEDIGYNCGEYIYHNGTIASKYIPDTDKEAVEFAAKVLDLDLEKDLHLVLNSDGTRYIEDESYYEY